MTDTASLEHRLYNLISHPEWSYCRPAPRCIAEDDQVIELTQSIAFLIRSHDVEADPQKVSLTTASVACSEGTVYKMAVFYHMEASTKVIASITFTAGDDHVSELRKVVNQSVLVLFEDLGV